MKDEHYQEKLFLAGMSLTELIEKLADEHFEDEKAKKEYVLCAVVNVLGNLAMRYAGSSVEAKKIMFSSVLANLTAWFGIALEDYSEEKEKLH